jgi:DNA-3-methyladenine glycosylase
MEKYYKAKYHVCQVNMNTLGVKFYNKKTEVVAKKLLGKYLFLKKNDSIISGMIVETEAYLHDDPASHSFKGLTERNKPMFGAPGHAYVYFIYGAHFCFNVVTGPAGFGEAVLIRALEPLTGIEKMQKNRGTKDLKNLTNGPAKLAEAFGIDKKLNGSSLINGPLRIYDVKIKEPEIVKTTRIGISKAQGRLLRFYIKDNPFVSKK